MATAMTADATQMKDLHGTHAIREPRPETCPRSSRRRDETRGVNVANNQGLDFCLVPQPKRVVYAFRAPRTDTAPPRTQSGDGSSRMIYCIMYICYEAFDKAFQGAMGPQTLGLRYTDAFGEHDRPSRCSVCE